MTQTYQIKESDIQVLASAESFARGQRYFDEGAVLEVTRRGNLIAAEVAGSDYDPYRVQVTLADSGIGDTTCSCPYDWGGICKHIVATLLAAIHEPETITEKPPIATLLAGLTAEQLRQILLGVAEMGPEIADAVEREVAGLRDRPITPTAAAAATPLPAVDLGAVSREIRKDFRLAGKGDNFKRGYYDEYAGMEVDPDEILGPHLEKMQELLDGGDVATAVSLISTIIDAYIDGLTELDEWVYEYNEDVLGEAALTLGAALAEALLSLELTPQDEAEWLEQIEAWAEGLGDLEIAETAVQHGWTYPPLVAALQGHITNKGAWADEAPDYFEELAQARLRILARQGRTQEYIYLAEAEGQTALAINMMAESGDVDKAITEAQAYLNDPTDVLALAHILAAKGEMDAALTIAEHGLGLERAQGKVALARWLREGATAVGNPPLALKAAQAAFSGSYELADYTAAQQLAGSAWQTIQPQLLQALAQSGPATRQVAIYLHEKMLVQAMGALDRGGFWLEDDLRRVIQATREKYPDWGIQKCQRKAEAIMDAGKAGAYETAVVWLRQAREIYQQHHRLAEWQGYLDAVLATHQRKYKLVPLLRAIR
jgi:uncharacterized Zn finger protein